MARAHAIGSAHDKCCSAPGFEVPEVLLRIAVLVQLQVHLRTFRFDKCANTSAIEKGCGAGFHRASSSEICAIGPRSIANVDSNNSRHGSLAFIESVCYEAVPAIHTQ